LFGEAEGTVMAINTKTAKIAKVKETEGKSINIWK
jgi:hypothetical protein